MGAGGATGRRILRQVRRLG